jgi:hypothetical protein
MIIYIYSLSYSKEKLLPRLIENALHGWLKSFEVVVVDGERHGKL